MPTNNAATLRRDLSNVDIMNAIRKNATVDYQRRIPDVTKATISDTISKLINYAPLRNEFVDVLINRIGLVLYASNNQWNNPLTPFKRGMLNWGDTIEEIMLGLAQAYTYDPQRDSLEQELFGQQNLEAQTSYHKVNRQNKYKITVNEPMLRRAFIDDTGLTAFLDQTMAVAQKSDQWDEFLLMANLFNEYNAADGFFNVNVPDFGTSTTVQADAQYALRQLRQYANILTFISRHYNAAGMPVHADIDDMIMVMTPEMESAMDVQALAAAFNVEYANFPQRKVVIPGEYIGIQGAQGFLTTKDFYVCADQLLETRTLPNPAGLYQNYFLHHWEVISVSRFVPAIMFSTQPSTVIAPEPLVVTGVQPITIVQTVPGNPVPVPVTTLVRGTTYQVNVNGIASDPTDYPYPSVVLSLVAKDSVFTGISQTGALFVAPDEALESLTIKAVSVDNPDEIATLTVPLSGDILQLWPDPQVIEVDPSTGLIEVTPTPPTMADNVVTIPEQTGIEYLNGTNNLDPGSTVTVEAGTPVTITAHAATGYEIAAGSTASWTFTYVAP